MADWLPGMDKTLHEVLTQLLMDNGAAVTKTSIDELIKFIGQRDYQTISMVIQDAEKRLAELQRQTRPIN
jgi:hypothetical protein